MSESEPRCQECGSWDRACSNPTPVFGCGCARCLSATVDALRVERDQAVQQAYRNLTVSLEATARAEKAEAEVERLREALKQSNRYIDESVRKREARYDEAVKKHGHRSPEAQLQSKLLHDLINGTRNSFDSVHRALNAARAGKEVE